MSRKQRKKISICIPVLNERENLSNLIEVLTSSVQKMSKYDFEFVFSDNGSADGSWETLKKIKKESKVTIRGIRFSENLGYQESILRNYFYATGDALIQFDADLQEPPELIADFIGLWEQGFDVVFGVRKRRDEPILKANMRKFGYRALRWLSGDSLHNDVGDFRLVDRKVVTALRSRNDLHPYLRGIVSNMGFREIGVPYERKDRILGKSKFRLRQVLGLGADGVLAFSQRPMRMFLHLALLLFFVAFGGIFWILGLYLSDSELPPGFSSTLIVIFLNLLVNVSFFAIAGDYLMKIRHALLPISRGHISDEL